MSTYGVGDAVFYTPTGDSGTVSDVTPLSGTVIYEVQLHDGETVVCGETDLQPDTSPPPTPTPPTQTTVSSSGGWSVGDFARINNTWGGHDHVRIIQIMQDPAGDIFTFQDASGATQATTANLLQPHDFASGDQVVIKATGEEGEVIGTTVTSTNTLYEVEYEDANGNTTTGTFGLQDLEPDGFQAITAQGPTLTTPQLLQQTLQQAGWTPGGGVGSRHVPPGFPWQGGYSTGGIIAHHDAPETEDEAAAEQEKRERQAKAEPKTCKGCGKKLSLAFQLDDKNPLCGKCAQTLAEVKVDDPAETLKRQLREMGL